MSQLSLRMAKILDGFSSEFDSVIDTYDINAESKAAIRELARITHDALCQLSDEVVRLSESK